MHIEEGRSRDFVYVYVGVANKPLLQMGVEALGQQQVCVCV